MKRTGLAGLLLLVLAVPAAHADVTVRVEGQTQTLLPRTSVAQTTTVEPNTGCDGDTAAAAIERATNGNWDRQSYVETVLGETHDFSNSDSWFFWIFRDGIFKVSNGVCSQKLSAGQDLLVAYGVFGEAPDYAPVVYPLWLTDVPAQVTRGVPFTVTVNKAACETAGCTVGEGHRVAGAGATVTAGGTTATADADGKATLTLPSAGPVSVRATGENANPSVPEAVTVVDPPAPGATPAPTASPSPAPLADTRPPYSAIRGIREQQVFRKRAPRTLQAVVDESVAKVTLGLTRQVGRRCTAFDDTRAAFVKAKCGTHPRFAVGEDSQVSYLLPKKLATGRYVLDVVSTDAAGNQERLARGRNRVVFFVK